MCLCMEGGLPEGPASTSPSPAPVTGAVPRPSSHWRAGTSGMQAMAAVMRLEPIAGGGSGADAPAADSASERSEAQLVDASVAGDEDAFAALVRRHQGRGFRPAAPFL